MIIKSMSRKTPSFDQLTSYMLAPKGALIGVAHNLPARCLTPDNIIQEFTDNHALLPGRVNGNALYHEILALPPNTDVPKKQQIAALKKIAARYLNLRAAQQLAVGVIHTETAHIHMHLMISSNAVLSQKRVWIHKHEFTEIQREIEEYKIQHFPEFGNTRLFAQRERTVKKTIREKAASLRTGQPSHKEQLAADVASVFEKARSREALQTALQHLGLTLYQRGQSVGIMTEGGRRYRLTTLGLGEAYTDAVARFELAESRMASLQRARRGRTTEHEREI